jgi:hypothetical protein
MEPALASLLGAAIGATAGITGGALTAWRQGQLEQAKWARARKDVLANDLRTTLQQLAVKLAAAVHSMCWLTWLARAAPSRVTQERIDAYDKELHELLPQITGLQAVVAAIDQSAYARLAALVAQVIEADWQIGNASLEFTPDNSKSAEALAACDSAAQKLHRDLPVALGQIISAHVSA